MYQFRVVEDHREKHQIYRLRYEVYCREKGWLPATGDSQAESDEYDGSAVHFGAFDADQGLLGAARLIVPRENSPLPIERAFGITRDPRTSCVEISRLVVRRDHRGRGVLEGLFRLLCRWGVDHHVARAYAVVEANLLGLLVRRGYPFTALGEPRDHFGALTRPIALDLGDLDPPG